MTLEPITGYYVGGALEIESWVSKSLLSFKRIMSLHPLWEDETMSIFRLSDYTGKKSSTYSKKEKIPTVMRTHKTKCSISGCPDHAPYPIVISSSQQWNLCRKHMLQNQSRDDRYELELRRASELL